MDFLAEDLEEKERASRKRWVRQLRKLYSRCVVKTCGAPLLDRNGRLRATNRVVGAVCRACRENHKRWFRWFSGKYSRTYFVIGNSLLKRRIDLDAVERFKFCRLIDDTRRPPKGIQELRFTRGEMKDGSPVPAGMKGPDLVDLLDRPESTRLPVGLKKPSKAERERIIAERKDYLPSPRAKRQTA